jgi:hypothetical protein
MIQSTHKIMKKLQWPSYLFISILKLCLYFIELFLWYFQIKIIFLVPLSHLHTTNVFILSLVFDIIIFVIFYILDATIFVISCIALLFHLKAETVLKIIKVYLQIKFNPFMSSFFILTIFISQFM